MKWVIDVLLWLWLVGCQRWASSGGWFINRFWVWKLCFWDGATRWSDGKWGCTVRAWPWIQSILWSRQWPWSWFIHGAPTPPFTKWSNQQPHCFKVILSAGILTVFTFLISNYSCTWIEKSVGGGWAYFTEMYLQEICVQAFVSILDCCALTCPKLHFFLLCSYLRTVQCQNGDGSQVLLQNSSQGFKSGYGRTNVAANKLGPFSPNQTSPSRLGQQQQQQQVTQAAHLQYWHQQQHAHLYPANHPQTHLHNAQRANTFQSTTNFKALSSGPVGQRYAAGEVVSSNSLVHPNLQFHQQQQFLSSQQQSADHQPLPNSPSSLSQRSHIPVEVDSMCNSPGGLLPSPQIESRWGYESSSSTGAGSSSNSGGYGGDGSPGFAHQAIFLPQHHFYSNNLFNGEYPIWLFLIFCEQKKSILYATAALSFCLSCQLPENLGYLKVSISCDGSGWSNPTHSLCVCVCVFGVW